MSWHDRGLSVAGIQGRLIASPVVGADLQLAKGSSKMCGCLIVVKAIVSTGIAFVIRHPILAAVVFLFFILLTLVANK
jgi:hypothetical protein